MKIKELVYRINSETIFYASIDDSNCVKVEIVKNDSRYPICYVPGEIRLDGIDNIVFYYKGLEEFNISISLEDIGDLYDLIKEYSDYPIEYRGLKEEKKYRVRVLKNIRQGYLNKNLFNGELSFNDDQETDQYTAKFTSNELQLLKDSDDLAIDWDKAIINPVED